MSRALSHSFVRRRHQLYGNPAFAGKAAGASAGRLRGAPLPTPVVFIPNAFRCRPAAHEIKGALNLEYAAIPGLEVPMQCLIDCCGYRSALGSHRSVLACGIARGHAPAAPLPPPSPLTRVAVQGDRHSSGPRPTGCRSGVWLFRRRSHRAQRRPGRGEGHHAGRCASDAPFSAEPTRRLPSASRSWSLVARAALRTATCRGTGLLIPVAGPGRPRAGRSAVAEPPRPRGGNTTHGRQALVHRMRCRNQAGPRWAVLRGP